jgi:hypothetical protein
MRSTRRIGRARDVSLLEDWVSAGTIVIVGVGVKHAEKTGLTDY